MSDSAWRQAPREGSSTATHELDLELELNRVRLLVMIKMRVFDLRCSLDAV